MGHMKNQAHLECRQLGLQRRLDLARQQEIWKWIFCIQPTQALKETLW